MAERVLLLTYSFPPTAVPEAVLSAKRIGNLGIEAHAITIAPFKAWMGDDHSLDGYIDECFASIERIEAPFVRRRLPLGRLGPIARVPDQFRLFNRLIESRAKQRLIGFDYLVTWSQWHSIHLVGRALHRTAGAPVWAAHLSDPWSNNPYVTHGSLLSKINRELERKVLAGADLLMFPSSETADQVLTHGPSEAAAKSIVLPHGFDDALYPSRTEPDRTEIVIRYVGHFYGPRSPEPLFEALHVLNERSPRTMTDVVIEITGNVPAAMLGATFGRLPDGQVRIGPPVDYRRSLQLMVDADILMVIDAPNDRSVFLPSKLVDYLGARRPIVGLTPPGPAADLIERYGGWVSDPRDIEGAARALRVAIDNVRAHPHQGSFGDPRVRAEYQVDEVSGRMLEALRAAAADRQRT